MILQAMASLYGAIAARRRDWFARHPDHRRRLARPVVSVGNLGVGGSGKTPVVETIARLLVSAGQRPAILTRGYARPLALDGVTVVSDGNLVVTDPAIAGDEPLMLARALAGVPVLVGADRYASGLLAERRFGATVHLLDDGFQHLQLARDVDLLVVADEDLHDAPMPAGHLRERLTAARVADAVVVRADCAEACAHAASALGVSTSFQAIAQTDPPRHIQTGAPVELNDGAAVFAVAGIARPQRFFSEAAAHGWRLVGTMAFPDHHWYTSHDLVQIAAAATAAGAEVVLTTAKDAVKLTAWCRTVLQSKPQIAALPLRVTIEPAAAFAAWLLGRLAS